MTTVSPPCWWLSLVGIGTLLGLLTWPIIGRLVG